MISALLFYQQIEAYNALEPNINLHCVQKFPPGWATGWLPVPVVQKALGNSFISVV
jgi:hypothetical protein